MNQSSYSVPNSGPDRVMIYQDAALEQWWSDLQKAQPKVSMTRGILNKICAALLTRVFGTIKGGITPEKTTAIYIFRGGLFFLPIVQSATPTMSCGFVIPHRPEPKLPPTIVYVDVSAASLANGSCLLFDLIVNTGETIVETLRALDALSNQIPGPASEMHLISPFTTVEAGSKIHNSFPKTTIHTFWNNMSRGPDGRLVGLGFDAGDYACGGGPRIRHVTLTANSASGKSL